MTRSNIGGFPVSPARGMGLLDRLIYYPEFGGGESLYDDPNDFNAIRTDFAGGALNGTQYDPVSNRFYALNPSGTYTLDSLDRDAPNTEEAGGDGAFTLAEIMELQSSLNQANFGNQDRTSVFSELKDMGNNTFDIVGGGGVVGQSLFGTTADGKRVPMNQAEYKFGARKGQKIPKQHAMNVLKAALAGIDESGGSDGSQGDSEGDSAQ